MSVEASMTTTADDSHRNHDVASTTELNKTSPSSTPARRSISGLDPVFKYASALITKFNRDCKSELTIIARHLSQIYNCVDVQMITLTSTMIALKLFTPVPSVNSCNTNKRSTSVSSLNQQHHQPIEHQSSSTITYRFSDEICERIRDEKLWSIKSQGSVNHNSTLNNSSNSMNRTTTSSLTNSRQMSRQPSESNIDGLNANTNANANQSDNGNGSSYANANNDTVIDIKSTPAPQSSSSVGTPAANTSTLHLTSPPNHDLHRQSSMNNPSSATFALYQFYLNEIIQPLYDDACQALTPNHQHVKIISNNNQNTDLIKTGSQRKLDAIVDDSRDTSDAANKNDQLSRQSSDITLNATSKPTLNDSSDVVIDIKPLNGSKVTTITLLRSSPPLHHGNSFLQQSPLIDADLSSHPTPFIRNEHGRVMFPNPILMTIVLFFIVSLGIIAFKDQSDSISRSFYSVLTKTGTQVLWFIIIAMHSTEAIISLFICCDRRIVSLRNITMWFISCILFGPFSLRLLWKVNKFNEIRDSATSSRHQSQFRL